MGLSSWDYNIEAKYEFTNIKEAIMIQFGMRVHDLCPKGPLLTVLDSIHDADIKHVPYQCIVLQPCVSRSHCSQ